MGETGGSGVLTDNNRGGGHDHGGEENQGKFQGVRDGNCRIFLRNHMEIFHGIVIPQTWGLDVGREVPETCLVSFPCMLKSVLCPV